MNCTEYRFRFFTYFPQKAISKLDRNKLQSNIAECRITKNLREKHSKSEKLLITDKLKEYLKSYAITLEDKTLLFQWKQCKVMLTQLQKWIFKFSLQTVCKGGGRWSLKSIWWAVKIYSWKVISRKNWEILLILIFFNQ